MNKTCKVLIQNYLMTQAHNFRIQHRLSQECMAEKLQISPRSYLDLEHGKYCFSLISLIHFLSLLPDEQAICLLHDFRHIVERVKQEAAEPLD